jgi:hypothetical protein
MRSNEFWAYFDSLREPLALRATTFATMFQQLDRIERPVVIIETGCTRQPGNWAGDGNSTVLFDHYAGTHPGSKVLSVDINPAATAACRAIVSERVSIHTGDSVKFLQSLADSRTSGVEHLDLVYLDSFDFDRNNPVPSAVHHLMELVAIAPLLRAETLLVVDDAFLTVQGIFKDEREFVPVHPPRIDGKARFVAEYAAHVGAELIFTGYQCGWTNMRQSSLSPQ